MILVFGANGFVGRNVVERLSREGRRTRAASRRIGDELRAVAGPTVELVEADMADRFQCAAALEGVEVVLNLVSASTPGLGNEYLVSEIETALVPQVSFIADCIGHRVRRLVFVSSGGAVYGIPRYLPIDEAHPCVPISSYGIIKLAIERYHSLFRHTRGLDYTILRVSNPFGPHQVFRKGQGLIPLALDFARRDRPVEVFGDGSASRDYVYVGDVVEAILRAAEAPAAAGETLNVGSGRGKTIVEVLDALGEALGAPIPRRFAPPRATDVPLNVLDVSRAAALLDWRATTSFEDGLTRMIQSQSRPARG